MWLTLRVFKGLDDFPTQRYWDKSVSPILKLDFLIYTLEKAENEEL
ncbi:MULTISPECIES: hypothetical protein [unclassified Microcoleus]